MVLLSRLIAALAYAGAAFLFGIGMGERGELGFVQQVFAAVIPIATVILAWRSPGARVDVTLTGAAMLAGLFIGQNAFRRAWDECLKAGPYVRVAVINHTMSGNGYPSRLEEIYKKKMPCECILRDTILHYLSNDRSFRLWISNDKETIHFTASGRSSSRSPTPPGPRR